MHGVRRTFLGRRRARQEKLRKLRQKYAQAQSQDQKSKILMKVQKVAPWLSEKEFSAPLEKKKTP